LNDRRRFDRKPSLIISVFVVVSGTQQHESYLIFTAQSDRVDAKDGAACMNFDGGPHISIERTFQGEIQPTTSHFRSCFTQSSAVRMQADAFIISDSTRRRNHLRLTGSAPAAGAP
jgi:hypothetical protein